MMTPEDVLGFWLDEVGPDGWYAVDPDLDARIRDRFQETYGAAMAGRLDGWSCAPRSALALVILLDQFPRNMFRGDGRAFASDTRALDFAKRAIARGFPARVEAPARQFFYLPLMHSEMLPDQDRCVRSFLGDDELQGNLGHARAHREVIRRFGRFPYRNDALGRVSTAKERAFLDDGGYATAAAAVGAA